MVALGECPADDAVEMMRRLGTSPKYKGLYADVQALRASPEGIASAKNEFPKAARLPGFVAAMADLDRRWDHMATIRKAGWKASPEHPDIDPPHEALQLRELFTELNRLDSVKSKPENFRAWLVDAQTASADLETAVRGGDADAAGRAHARIEKTCTSCHEAYRNTK